MFSSLKSRYRYGFTLIELLLVIGIIAILASIVIVAINPTKQLGEARNAQRRSDVNAVLQAVYQYAIDNNGALPGNIATSEAEICDGAYASETCTGAGGVDLSDLVGTYITAIPRDPQETDANWTGYYILQDSNGRVTVSASGAELDASISVTR
ncbi:MAG: prepilin-type N-terminal cleavage/methylation domain-containing protein [Candidatus Peribacteraceae bacterium]|nr:prepilin-type N-terminal cleavage/methylation domain-containing protein [Candidatus Peribacteraceae bacterium]